MMFIAMLFALLIENATTHCATTNVTVTAATTDKQLVGCGSDFPDNVLWNLDLADGISDGIATRATRGRGAVVYVVDTGVDAAHDEMRRNDGSSRVIAGLDATVEMSTGARSGACAQDSATSPCFQGDDILVYTHGTAVASVIAGRTAGVAPDASIVAVRTQANGVRWPSGTTDLDIFIRCLDDIVKHAFDPSTPAFRTAVVNMSNIPSVTAPGSTPRWAEFEGKLRMMIGGVDVNFNPDPNGKRFLFVVLAGNNNFTNPNKSLKGHCLLNNDAAYYPPALGSSIDGLITVGGIDRQNNFWSGSCGGSAVDILAPAESILVASISAHDHYRGTSGGVDYTSGTSYAAPYVAGIAARMLESDPTLTPVQIEQRIKDTAGFIFTPGAPAGGRVAILNERPAPPHRRAAAH